MSSINLAPKRPDALRASANGTQPDDAPPPAYRNRVQLLAADYQAFADAIGLRASSASHLVSASTEILVPHPHLRQMLQADPGMAALLPGSPCRIALGSQRDFPFRLKAADLLLLPPSLLDSPPTLAAAARWGMETAFGRQAGQIGPGRLAALLAHGRSLLLRLEPEDRALLLDSLPDGSAADLLDSSGPTSALLAWMADLAGADSGSMAPDAEPAPCLPFDAPVEDILLSNGDSRIRTDPRTGKNRYGTTLRPRPEAVHFSSSTASSISDYGFLFCDMLRRDLLGHVVETGIDGSELRARLSDAVVGELCKLCGLEREAADGIVAPSGTDTEVLAVLLARAAAPDRPLVNILIAPEETGRGVTLAATGRYFDEQAATGAPVEKGAEIWPGARISHVEIGIRDPAGERVPLEELDARVLAAGRAALDGGARVLVHGLIGSKTGLSGPSHAAVERLQALAPDRVDVVVDACQMRVCHGQLGACVERGWMVQVSGSKSLTGPPFSGALLVPPSMRDRVGTVPALLRPGVGYPEDWSAWWSARIGRSPVPPAFGAPFRWLPALLEAKLLDRVPDRLRTQMLERFRAEVTNRLARDPSFQVLPREASDGGSYSDQMAKHSIISFQVLARLRDGSRAALNEAECRRIFELLNQDARGVLPSASRTQQALLKQEFHIGQPVALGSGEHSRAVLRLVLGLRFFNIVAHAGPGSIEAALESEIADLIRAIDKLEILASHWGSYGDDLS